MNAIYMIIGFVVFWWLAFKIGADIQNSGEIVETIKTNIINAL